MYRNCIFCSGKLGSNDSIEHFPVGRTLAFDGGKGRLWAVCPKCARWNLAPIEERWEAIEEAEKQFRDSRLRAQSENIGLAKLRDGTRLIRIGKAVPGELAVWRYGEQMERRGRRAMWYGAVATGVGVLAVGAGVAVASVGGLAAWSYYRGARELAKKARRFLPVGWVQTEIAGVSTRVHLRREDVHEAWLSVPDDGKGIALNLPFGVEVPDPSGRSTRARRLPLVLRGPDAKRVMARAMVHVNVDGASRLAVERAVNAVRQAGGPDEYLHTVGRRRLLLTGGDPRAQTANWGLFDISIDPAPDPATSLAVEMAVHEESERRAMQGELAALEEMWRQAEEIAGIADALPDALGAAAKA